MSSIGPSLPPHLSKRSRDDDSDAASSPESSDKRRRVAGPAPPPRVMGPSRPPPSDSPSSSPEGHVGPAPIGPAKPVRVMGPAPPPAPLNERPPNPPSDDSDSSDDDFGPAPPPAGAAYSAYEDGDDTMPQKSAFDTEPHYVEQAKKVQRDEWMTMPPTQDDLAARMDPTKVRARKFNSGKGPSDAASAGGIGVWTETPEQKLKRLQNEALGIAAPVNTADAGKRSKRAQVEEKPKKMRERPDSSRGKSLMEQHVQKGTGKEKEDDPSKRKFDYEKDMGAGMKIGNKQRNELLKRAKDFGDRFSSGSYL
jgi:hypothetical protein